MDSSLSVRILTHNVRYATKSPGPNEKPWKERLPLSMNQFSYHTRFLTTNFEVDQLGVPGLESNGRYAGAFICLQEVLHNQLDDILKTLNNVDENPIRNQTPDKLPEGSRWSHIGVAREDGNTEGEYSPILYPTHLFTLLHFETVWLSPIPNKPNHAGTVAREKSIGVILDVIKRIRSEWRKKTPEEADEDLQYVLTGDFNSSPTQEAYQAIARSNISVDVHEAVSKTDRYGSETTFMGFKPSTGKDKGEDGRIDYIWLDPKDGVHREEQQLSGSKGWHVHGYSVLPNVFDDGIFAAIIGAS